ncbi:MAG: restriction endonuclease, partial [Acetobacteraceae bacterium]
SGGDTNLYALFVERALRLVKAEGIVGLLVPSGIAADKGAAAFFRSIAATGRLGALLELETGRGRAGPFFPDVHRSFKFAALVAGGPERRFDAAACAFFAQSAEEAEASGLALSPDDFAAVNPNTGTAPVFRGTRDAEITLAVYRRVPVLVDQRSTPHQRVWPVRYVRMFDMTNDSDKFLTEAELQKDGAYRVAPNRWKKGATEWAPLYEGKMVQAYDHRAASVTVNPENINRPAQPETTTVEQHANPAWMPNPQFWVGTTDVEWPSGPKWGVAFKDITAATNARTMIAAAVPFAAVGNTLPLLFPLLPDEPKNDASAREAWLAECDAILAIYRRGAPLLLANLNALPLDYIARQKVQS